MFTSSTRYCWPIRFEFMKETAELIRKELAEINTEIKMLQVFNGKDIEIDYNLIMTMIDGKVCLAVSEKSSAMRCYMLYVTLDQSK